MIQPVRDLHVITRTLLIEALRAAQNDPIPSEAIRVIALRVANAICLDPRDRTEFLSSALRGLERRFPLDDRELEDMR